MKTKVIVVIGPTAVGKTALGIELAQRYKGEIISGDSQQVYCKLDIGTAKASPEEQAAAVHHLIDVRDVTEGYSAYEFVAEAKALIADITSRGKLPIIVGGTGLYIQSLLEGYHLGGQVDQEQVLAYRAELDNLPDEVLETMAEQAGLTVEGNSRRRIIRGLELKKFGKNLENTESEYEPLCICLTDDRQVLYDRINQRVDKMMAAGLLDEVSWLYKEYPQAQAAMGIGYKEFFPYLAGQISLEEAVDKVKQNSRRFAKRQLTWFRNRMQVPFYSVGKPDYKSQIFTAVEEFLND
ncbi:tRNA (adenosine(37)-N6)-dimethylallyltransferase MiaA [Streptococcus suis]|uniref:tRNA (adenosine(37)-N6)-dimethylallyltransferase MiaA n=1 Tax=Streptococcus suis TaxID=1307 RepID=UPI000CF409EA|nr:tRNA (adenosine(37)-N6)-dimethylallyltransferase MiaA [Streptococcus suis]